MGGCVEILHTNIGKSIKKYMKNYINQWLSWFIRSKSGTSAIVL